MAEKSEQWGIQVLSEKRVDGDPRTGTEHGGLGAGKEMEMWIRGRGRGWGRNRQTEGLAAC